MRFLARGNRYISMRSNYKIFGIQLVLAMITAAPAGASMDKLLRIGPTATPPIIDGTLLDSCWQTATMASGFATNYGEWPRAQTTGYLTYDDTAIYIAFRCNTTAASAVNSRTTANDDEGIFGDSSVEVFLDTNHDRTAYYQFVVNSTGTHYEGYIKPDDGIREAQWNPQWEVRTKVFADHWTAEMRIPFVSLVSAVPEGDEVWGINLNRNYYEEGLSEHSSWAMIRGGFNRPRNFGELHFGSPAGFSYSILDMASEGLRLKLRNSKKTSLAVQTEWASADLLAAPMSRAVVTRLAANEEKDIYIRYDTRQRRVVDVPLTHKGPKMGLTVSNSESGEVYDYRTAWVYWGSFLFPPLPAVTMDRYYYPESVRQAQVTLTAELENADRFDVGIRREPDGEPLSVKRIQLGDHRETHVAAFDIGELDSGRYLMVADLRDKEGERLHTVRRVFFKRKITPAKLPSPRPEISIRPDGILLLDKQPFCPFLASKPTSPLCQDAFNVRFGSQGVVSRPLERLSLGFPGLTRPDGPLVMVLPEEEEFREHLRSVIAGHADNPLVFSWWMAYEAEFPMYRAGPQKVRLKNADALRRISDFVKSINPNHLTAVQIDQGHWTRYKDSADIIEVACPGSSYMRQLIPELINDVKEVRSELGPAKPFLLWLGASLPYPRTAEEIRGATYLALMHGAGGIVFHMGHGGISLELTRHWSVYTGLSRELEVLFPILAAQKPSDELKIAVEPAGALDFCVRIFENKTYLAAVNTSDSLVSARISIGHASRVLTDIVVLFENRQIIPDENSFTDAFTSFEPRVYELRELQ